jgi:hypothetical protein
MKLILDHTQRLNLHALIGAQRCNVDDTRLWWKVQDRIDLSAEEKKAIDFRVQQVNGMQQVAWDPSKQLPPAEYEFSPDELAKIQKTVQEWQPGFMIQADRQWLEPLLEQLENGQPKDGQSRVN